LRSTESIEERCSYRGEIPGASSFYRGPTQYCSFYDDQGVLHTDGTRWLWIEGLVLPEQPPGVDLTAPLDAMLASEAARFAAAYRTFTEFCDGVIIGYPIVGLRDPLLFPGQRVVDQLRARIAFPTVTISTLPDPSLWGGVIVNNPALLGIDAASWQVQTTSGTYRAWTTHLTAVPTALTFTVADPSRADPTTTVPCQAAFEPVDPASGRFPPEPTGFRATPFDPPGSPLPPRPCVFTPRHKHPVSVTATVTYTVWFDYGPYRLAQPDFTRTATITIPTVELTDVNVIPTNP
jgi:hypothetical protein